MTTKLQYLYSVTELDALILAHVTDTFDAMIDAGGGALMLNGAALVSDDEITTLTDLLAQRRAALRAKSWILMIHGCGDPKGKFTHNALRFETYEQAKGYEFNLSMRWFGFDESYIDPSPLPATHGWDEEKQCSYDLTSPETGYQSLGKVEDARMVDRS